MEKNTQVAPRAETSAPATLMDKMHMGAVSIEQSRAVAEAQGKLILAKKFPRNTFAALEAVRAACARPSLARAAFYSFQRGGQTVSGPSIRLAEELARCWGNIDYGIRELSSGEGETEMEAYCWDMETNTQSSQRFQVRHVRDTKQGRKVVTDQRDIYELNTNNAARRLRSRILAIMPPDLVDEAVEQCKATLAGHVSENIEQTVAGIVKAFARYGVSVAHIEARLGHPLSRALPEELVELQGIGSAIRDGVSKASDFFGVKDASAQEAAQARLSVGAPVAARPEPEEAPEPEANPNSEEAVKDSAAKAFTKAEKAERKKAEEHEPEDRF